MIVRIMTEGQYELDGDQLESLKHADEELLVTVRNNDAEGFRSHLATALAVVRGGQPVHASVLKESELVLPAPDMTVREARRLFDEHQIL
jgi:hypothetical protein